jgi:hypothetical protein
MSVTQAQTILSKIRERGYWRVVIRPTSFEEKHIPEYSELFRIVERNAVRLRGWDYPHIDYKSQPERGNDWVGQEFQWEDELEVWRLYQSGQFVHYFAIAEEWRDESSLRPPDQGWAWGRHMYYISTVYSFLEIYEFAARLALSPAGGVMMHVEIELGNLKGRRLIPETIDYQLGREYRITLPTWEHVWEGAQTELIASPRELAALATRELFARFGLDLGLDILKKLQGGIGR